ncbi:MAG: hypothetical protein WC285_04520 [Candidatus Gracilibacteria bacterium]|jgi:hypothetical protein
MINMNQKGFTNVAIIILIVAVLGVAGYFAWNNWSSPPITNDGTHSPNEIESNWQLVDADSFTLSLPTGWKFNKLQGIDSYVGEFVGDGAKLSFDYGRYSNPLADENDPDHTVTYETIDGYKAKIVIPKVTGDGTTGVYFADLGGKIQETSLQISGRDLTASQREPALNIFRTIKIVK